MPQPLVTQIGTRASAEPDLDKRLRIVWGENMASQMKVIGLTAKTFCRALEDEEELEVTLQTVYGWLSGQWAPAPSKRPAIARVLKASVNLIFVAEAA